MSQKTTDSVLDRLEAVRSQYHRQDLRSALNELGDELAELLMKQALYEGLFDTSIEINEAFRSAIAEALEQLEAGNVEAVENQIEVIETERSEFESALQQAISDPLTKYRSDVESMQRLNQKLEKIDPTQLEELRTFLQPGHLAEDVDHEPDVSIDEKIEKARSVGEDQRSFYQKAIRTIFEPYLDDDVIGDLVEVLVANDDLRVDEVDPNQFEALHDSELASHIELQFG
ncbi:hypothetical protein [Salinigranum sp. GCM10025319]|uniref:hypothetical protein n=1 Tax=Salinigranum sp. GCM10025319 TaxID=3252687 RepID=UPI0036215125